MSGELTPWQRGEVLKNSRRVANTPRGRTRGASTNRTPPTGGLLAVLTSDMKYDTGESPSTWKASFKYYAPENAADDDSPYAEVSTGGVTLYCWPWCLKNGEYLASGSRVIIAWTAGRFHVVEYIDCPELF